MSGALKAACVQLNVGTELGPNLAEAERLIREAASQGAELIVTPECTGFIVQGRRKTFERVQTEEEHPGIPLFSALAKELRVHLLIGSLAILLPGQKVANRSFLFGPDGATLATYDKIHMFDVDLPDGETYRESNTYEPGTRAVLAESPWGGLGMTICYDVRFAPLYRALAKAGAAIITVPAAFTKMTGEAHWHVLLRTRAIETGCFVIAAAQTGTHDEGRQTFGHSLIIAPWGEVLADGGEATGVVTAELDLARVAKARSMVPSLRHDRDFESPEAIDPPAAASAAE